MRGEVRGEIAGNQKHTDRVDTFSSVNYDVDNRDNRNPIRRAGIDPLILLIKAAVLSHRLNYDVQRMELLQGAPLWADVTPKRARPCPLIPLIHWAEEESVYSVSLRGTSAAYALRSFPQTRKSLD
jgi:hypothetical protein